jgi:hypothetical protein
MRLDSHLISSNLSTLITPIKVILLINIITKILTKIITKIIARGTSREITLVIYTTSIKRTYRVTTRYPLKSAITY